MEADQPRRADLCSTGVCSAFEQVGQRPATQQKASAKWEIWDGRETHSRLTERKRCCPAGVLEYKLGRIRWRSQLWNTEEHNNNNVFPHSSADPWIYQIPPGECDFVSFWLIALLVSWFLSAITSIASNSKLELSSEALADTVHPAALTNAMIVPFLTADRDNAN